MQRTSIFALFLTLLIAAFGSAAFGQITVNGDTSVFDKPAATQPRLGTYGGGDDARYRRNSDGTLASGPQYQYLITVEPRAGNNYPLSGRAMLRGGQYTISGTLYGRSGTFRAVAHRQGEPDEYFDGTGTADGLVITHLYDRGRKYPLTIPLNFVSGSYAQQQTASAPKLQPQPQSKPVPAGATFGLVSKVLGHVPPPGEGNNSTISGSMDERSFRIEIRMKPPFIGSAVVTHHYSSPLTSRLKPGQIVELTCTSEAERTGRDAPNLGSGCQWGVSGSGAEVLESTHTFAGAGSDGFHPSSQAVTRFKVLKTGTITIVAGQNGQLWGGSDNWNPATYVYKSGEIPAASVNQ
ncbi:MAG: hypothetical protein QOF71_1129 [Candidatus Eremiobacteraeota bacterium]|jgi:hypothetical protein|nr:hypothetical protein [Candidatus Eremiobacteraeota bacterium]